jgi:hypothetical protein
MEVVRLERFWDYQYNKKGWVTQWPGRKFESLLLNGSRLQSHFYGGDTVYFIGFPSSLLALGVRSCDTNKI